MPYLESKSERGREQQCIEDTQSTLHTFHSEKQHNLPYRQQRQTPNQSLAALEGAATRQFAVYLTRRSRIQIAMKTIPHHPKPDRAKQAPRHEKHAPSTTAPTNNNLLEISSPSKNSRNHLTVPKPHSKGTPSPPCHGDDTKRAKGPSAQDSSSTWRVP